MGASSVGVSWSGTLREASRKSCRRFRFQGTPTEEAHRENSSPKNGCLPLSAPAGLPHPIRITINSRHMQFPKADFEEGVTLTGATMIKTPSFTETFTGWLRKKLRMSSCNAKRVYCRRREGMGQERGGVQRAKFLVSPDSHVPSKASFPSATWQRSPPTQHRGSLG